MKVYKQKVIVSMSDEDFEDVVDIAGYGINYWCHKAIVDTDLNQYTVIWWEDGMGDDSDTLNSVTLTKTHLENAWAKIIQGDVQVNEEIRQYFDTDDMGDIDATCGDVLIQVALFGEIVYG